MRFVQKVQARLLGKSVLDRGLEDNRWGEVNQREEGVGDLHLTIMPFKTYSLLEPILRCERSTKWSVVS